MTSQRANWIKAHPLAAYYILAFLITWVAVLPLILQGLGVPGITLSENWHALGALGPVAAAVIVTAVVGGRPGLAEFTSRLKRWNVGAGWQLIAVLSPFALFGAAILMVRLFGGAWPDWSLVTTGEYATFAWLGGRILSSAVYGIGEEPGWRGFALPRLQHGRGALSATLLLTIFWAIWHVPMFTYRFDFGLVQVIGFFIGLVAGAIWFTFLYNATGGSTLMTVLWHFTWNIVNVIGLVVSVDAVSVMSALVMVAAVVILLVWKPRRLSPREPHTLP